MVLSLMIVIDEICIGVRNIRFIAMLLSMNLVLSGLTGLMTEENKLVCHRGYISIFPLLLGLVPADSPHLGALLDVMSDPDHLWSDYGLRSLSKSDEYYSTGENYWRGPIWINMNYLALSSLYKVSSIRIQSDVELHVNMGSISTESKEDIHRSQNECG